MVRIHRRTPFAYGRVGVCSCLYRGIPFCVWGSVLVCTRSNFVMCQMPGPTAPLYIHKGATSWELRAVKFQLSRPCQVLSELRQLSSSRPCQISRSCELRPATFLPRRELSKFDFFINLCYNIIRKRKDKFWEKNKIHNLFTIYSYCVHIFMI